MKRRITLDSIKEVVTPRTKVIAIAHISNVLGHVADIKSITKLRMNVILLLL